MAFYGFLLPPSRTFVIKKLKYIFSPFAHSEMAGFIISKQTPLILDCAWKSRLWNLCEMEIFMWTFMKFMDERGGERKKGVWARVKEMINDIDKKPGFASDVVEREREWKGDIVIREFNL